MVRLEQWLDGGRGHDALIQLEAALVAGTLDGAGIRLLLRARRHVGDVAGSLELVQGLLPQGPVDAFAFADILFELANLRAQAGAFAEADQIYQQLSQLDEYRVRCLANRYRIAHNLCDWSLQQRLRAELMAVAADVHHPWQWRAAEACWSFELCNDPLRNLALGRLRATRLTPVDAGSPATAPDVPHDRRLRIGYLGEPLRNHARAFLLTGVLEHHDRDRFEVFAYATGPDDRSAARQRIEAAVDGFRSCHGAGDTALATTIRADRLDLLVATDGWHHGNRMAALAGRLAPVQVSYLGYPSTTGADFIDCAIADPVTLPPGCEHEYSERVIRLPVTYQATDDRQPVPPSRSSAADFAAARREHGLPPDAVVLASFNQPYKIDEATLALWFALLRELPGSVLWLLAGHPLAGEALLRAATEAGIAPARIIMAGKLPRAEHLARISLADLALDPLLCNGHTTTSDALWAGVPVVAMTGQHFASRVAASLITAAGMPDLVVPDRQAYQALVARLVRDSTARAHLRERLIAGRSQSPLFDTAGRTRELEQVYQGLIGGAVS